MKFNLIIFILLIGLVAHAQTFEIRTHYVSESDFDVQMRCTSGDMTTNETILDLTFNVKWDKNYNIDLATPDPGDYNIYKSGNE